MSCVCRALLIVVAVSCTLSRTHAHGPSTQRLDRIKDLMCVLLLSGMQKEDLDVKMLNKLERHNVNIHDMNNGEILKKCITNHSEKTIILSQNQETDNQENAIKQNGETMDGTNLLSSNVKPSKTNTTLNIERTKNNDMIQYIDGQPELQSVIKFWQDFKMPKSSTESSKKSSIVNQLLEENFKYDQKNKRNVPDAFNSYEADTVQKLLANFLLKKENRKIAQTTDRKISMNKFKDFFDTRNNKGTNFYKYNRTDVTLETMTQFPVKAESRKNKNVQPKEEKDNFNDILNAIKTLKTYYTPKNEKSDENDVRSNKQNLAFENLYLNRFLSSISASTTTEKLESSSIAEHKIPQNMIQEIAKSVKELVLQDLRKEILQIKTTSYFTTATTKVSTTEASKADNQIPVNKGTNRISTNQISEQSILNKFIDLFEEIKSLKHKTVIISSEIIKGNNKMKKKESSMQTHPVMPIEIPEIGSPITNYGINQYANFKMQNSFDFSPQIHKFRSKGELKSKKQITIKSTQPITFQTNNMEIPPLGIPVDKPENPINQNIIVPTLTPYRIGDYKFDLHKIQLPNSRIGIEEFDQKLLNTPLAKSADRFEQNQQNVQRLPSYNNEFPNYSHIKHKDASNNIQVKNPVIARYHEKLEKNTDYFDVPEKNSYTESVDCCNKKYAFSKQMAECCNHKIASRQQMSFNALKNKSYDDIHFKNFLKSQQKVTDMLEKVLAARGRVRSVETN